jgi:hypothetical protein
LIGAHPVAAGQCVGQVAAIFGANPGEDRSNELPAKRMSTRPDGAEWRIQNGRANWRGRYI